MSEYIIEYDDSLEIDMFTRADLREEIVRCRDCKHYRIVDEVHYMDGDGWDDIPVYGCTYLALAHARIDDDMQEPQDPDGFCAWGEKREA